MSRGRITYPVHAALELGSAAVLIAVPFAIGLSVDATITAAVIGVLLFGLAASATGDGRGSLPVSAHEAYDTAIVFALIGAAVFFGVLGQELALAFLLAAGVAQLVLTSFTRYSVAGAHRLP